MDWTRGKTTKGTHKLHAHKCGLKNVKTEEPC